MFGQDEPVLGRVHAVRLGVVSSTSRGTATGTSRAGAANIAFFPVYPLLMRYVGRALRPAAGDLYLGGIVVSWVAFALAMVVLYRLARLDLPRRRAERAVLLTAIFPFAFFYGVVYTESGVPALHRRELLWLPHAALAARRRVRRRSRRRHASTAF